MRVTDYLKRGGVAINATVYDRDSAIRRLVDLMDSNNCLWNSDVFKTDLLKRESYGTTAIGDGFAIPHAKSDGVKALSLSLITVPQGIDFNSPDGIPVKFIFMMAAPKNAGDSHLDLLAQLMMLVCHLFGDEPKNRLLQARTSQELIATIDFFEHKARPDWKSEPLEAPLLTPPHSLSTKKAPEPRRRETGYDEEIKRSYFEKEFSRKQDRRAHYNEPYPISDRNQTAKKSIHAEAPRTKCRSCGSVWTAIVDVAACPFCGKPLKPVDKTDSTFSKLLLEIKNEFGVQVFKNPPKVKSILKDKAPELKQDIKLFSIALDSGLYSDAPTQTGRQDYYTVLQKNRHILTDSFFLNEASSSKITEWYCGLLDIKPPEE